MLTMVLRLRNLRSRFAYETTYEYWDTVMDGFKKSKLEIAPDAPLAWQASNELTKRIEEHAMYALLDPDIGSCRDAGVDYKWKNVGWQNRGKRQPLSKVLFYSGYKKSPDDYPLIKGANLGSGSIMVDERGCSGVERAAGKSRASGPIWRTRDSFSRSAKAAALKCCSTSRCAPSPRSPCPPPHAALRG